MQWQIEVARGATYVPYLVNVLFLVFALGLAVILVAPPIEVHLQPVHLLLLFKQLRPVRSLFLLGQKQFYTPVAHVLFRSLKKVFTTRKC